MDEISWTREPHGSAAEVVFYHPDGTSGLEIEVVIDDILGDPAPVLATLDERLGPRAQVPRLGGASFDDARAIIAAERDGPVRRYDPPLTLREFGEATGFHGLRLDRAIAARDVLAGVLEVEVVRKARTEEIDG